MRLAWRTWHWLATHLPERVLRTFDSVPFVIVTRQTLHHREVNAFTLGRDHERGLQREAAQQ